jgi:VWFA-related protein
VDAIRTTPSARIAIVLGTISRVAAAIAAAMLFVAPHPSAQQATFRSGVRTVAVYATVHGPDGHLSTGLEQQDFEILDNGRPVEIALFSNDVLPITVVLLLDTSTSMTPEAPRVRQSAAEFINRLLPGDRVRLGTFGEEVALSPLLSGDKPTLHRILREEFWPGGKTPLWTALLRGMQSLRDEAGRKVVLILTDGDNECSGGQPCAKAADVRREMETQGVLLYSVGMAGAPLGADIVRFSRESGGGYFNVADNVDLTQPFTQVADELHRQYLLGFTPPLLDGKTHTLDVKVRRAGFVVQARRSYVAAGDR